MSFISKLIEQFAFNFEYNNSKNIRLLFVSIKNIMLTS
jgi:hypothetical protein